MPKQSTTIDPRKEEAGGLPSPLGKRTLPAFYKPERALKVQNESIHFHPTGTFPQALGKLPLGGLKGSPAEGPALFLQGRAPSGPAEPGGAQEELPEP